MVKSLRGMWYDHDNFRGSDRMEFERLYAPSLKDLFVQQLQDMILSGELSVGTKLPPERELCQQMHVSRAVVNSGIAELSRQGFVEVRPRQGNYVADYRRNGNMDTLMALMHYNGGLLAKDEIRSILEVRWGLEQMAISRAIENATDKELEALGEFVEALGSEENPPTPAQAAELAFAFHHGMTLTGGNSILPLIYSSFKVPCTALWIRFCRKYGVAALYANVEKLYRCLLDRDAKGATAWTNDYLTAAISGAQQIYEA